MLKKEDAVLARQLKHRLTQATEVLDLVVYGSRARGANPLLKAIQRDGVPVWLRV